MDNKDYTLLLPFLAREGGYDDCCKVLGFYKSRNVEERVLISLSGTAAEKEIFERTLKAKGFRPKVYDYPVETSDQLGIEILYDKLLKAVDLIDTPYVAMASADDFSFPEAIEKACVILGLNQDVSATSGHGILYNPESRKEFIYPQYARSANGAPERLKEYIKNPTSVFYSVFRTNDLKEILRETTDFIRQNLFLIQKNIAFSEHIFSFFTVVKGKVATVDDLYFVRLQHSQQASARLPNLLENYINGDVEEFVRRAAEACNIDKSIIRSAYCEYIFRRGRRDPFFILKRPQWIRVHFIRSFSLLVHSFAKVLYLPSPSWELDDIHKAYTNRRSYQDVIGLLA